MIEREEFISPATGYWYYCHHCSIVSDCIPVWPGGVFLDNPYLDCNIKLLLAAVRGGLTNLLVTTLHPVPSPPPRYDTTVSLVTCRCLEETAN